MTPIDADVCTETAYGLYSVAEDSLDEREERVDTLRYKLDWNTNPMSTLTLNMVCKTEDGKTKEVSRTIQPFGKISGGAKVTYEWGGSEPPVITTSIYTEVKDDQGKSAEVQIDYTQTEDRNSISVDAHGSKDTQIQTPENK